MPMSTFENIDGNKLLPIFQELVSQKILVKVYLPKIDFESLTLIIDTNAAGKHPTFIIDAPKGLHQAIAETNSKRLSFEFNSSDQVTHRFYANIDIKTENTISCYFPPFIQRHQQRDNFRVKVSPDSHAILHIENQRIHLEIDNVSLGGTYCFCPNKYKSKLSRDLELEGLELVFSIENQCVNVPIQRAKIKRVESRHRPKHFGVALEFAQIKRDYKKLLVQYIYNLQRAYLQNRLKIM